MTNLHHKLFTGPIYKGLPVYNKKGPLNLYILEKIERVISNALEEHARTLIIRFDLRFPDTQDDTCYQSNVISKFTESLKAKVKYDIQSKQQAGMRVHPCKVRFLWVKEIKTSLHPHYHVAILVNRDKYLSLGRFGSEADNMVNRIQSAWNSALGLDPDNQRIELDYQRLALDYRRVALDYQGLEPDCQRLEQDYQRLEQDYERLEQDNQGLVYFPDNCIYKLEKNGPNFNEEYKDLFYRLSYLAKFDTKAYSHNFRTFNGSFR